MFDVAASYTTNQCHDWMAARRNAVISLKNGTALRCLFYSTVKFIGLLLPLLSENFNQKKLSGTSASIVRLVLVGPSPSSFFGTKPLSWWDAAFL